MQGVGTDRAVVFCWDEGEDDFMPVALHYETDGLDSSGLVEPWGSWKVRGCEVPLLVVYTDPVLERVFEGGERHFDLNVNKVGREVDTWDGVFEDEDGMTGQYEELPGQEGGERLFADFTELPQQLFDLPEKGVVVGLTALSYRLRAFCFLDNH